MLATNTVSHPLFPTIPELQIMVCRQCKHAVHPTEVHTHLHKKHYMTTSQIQPVIEIVQKWAELIKDPGAVRIPRVLDQPLPITPLHSNGMQCQRDPPCLYNGSCLKSMRKHWQQAHSWTQHPHRGHVTAEVKAQGGGREVQEPFRMVTWQQVFPKRKNSHLVHIRSCDPEPDERPTPTPDHRQIAAEIKSRAADDEHQAARQSAESKTLHGANPWLRMTRWARYPAGVEFTAAAKPRLSVTSW